MDLTWLQPLSLSELLTRRKYRNVENILTAQLTYFHDDHGNFDFQGDIFDNPTATMAFRVIQFRINRSFIQDLCWAYVFDVKPTDTNNESKIHSQLLSSREFILQKYRLVEDLLDMPAAKNAKRYFTAMKNRTGYQTIGDAEWDLALYLSPFCSYQQFSNCLGIIEEKLPSSIDGPWIGLFDHLRTSSMPHFKELEEFAKGKLIAD